MKYTTVHNLQSIPIEMIPVVSYKDFFDTVISLFEEEEVHCVNYFAYPIGNELHLICSLADDRESKLKVLSWKSTSFASVPSLSTQIPSIIVFEREIYENYGITFIGHPWLKPLRYAKNRANEHQISDYPFFKIESEELHEVGVGPIHAGIIEPGHFRFICNGERILHLEIQLGYQHRGIENLFLNSTHLNQRIALSESIAGDTATAHASAFANLWESLCDVQTSQHLLWQRNLSVEIERIAMHTGDMAAICTDVAYQLGNAVLGRLRTPMVNFMQEWCGNRLGKSLIRPFNSFYAFTPELKERLLDIFSKYEPDFNEIWDRMKTLPSLLSRLEKTGVVSRNQMIEIGAVGMSARAAGLERDVRASHPYGLFKETPHQPITKKHGDVYSRTQLRNEEIIQSVSYIKHWLENIPDIEIKDASHATPKPSTFCISLTEGWRGEICHCAITDEKGNLIAYKIKDPSLHNWLALALAVRNNEISDFPIINKSFNLSYCGFDL